MSILVANYNYAHYVGAALDSVLAQGYGHFEALVCDDGSSDGSRAVIEEYASRDGRVKLIAKPNGGVASALNVAYGRSTGDIICLLDADDVFEPDKLDRVVAAFATGGCGLLVHPLLVVDGDGAGIQRKPAFSRFEEGWIASEVLARGGRWAYMESSAVCFRRELAGFLFPIPEDLFRTWADAYLCSLGALLTPVGYVDEPLAHYRIHSSNVSGFNSFAEDHGIKAMDGFNRLVEGVNRRLGSMHIDVRLRVEDNLAYLESLMQAELFAPGTPRLQLARTFITYASRVWHDDIYGTARKTLSIFFMGTAILLPRRRRASWLSTGLTHSRAKESVRRLARYARARARRGA